MNMSQQEAALRQHLVNTIINPQVIEPMNQAGWSQGTYEQQMSSGQPAMQQAPNTPPMPNQQSGYQTDNPTAAAPQGYGGQPNSPLDFEQFRDTNGLYAGKYKTPEELVKGMRNVVDMAKQAFTERDELRARLAQPTTAPAPSAPVATSALPTTVDDGTGNLDRVLNQIVEEGGLLDERNSALLRDAVIKLAEDKARNVVNAQSTEEAKWQAVSQKMELNYPGSSNRADELHVYVQANPSVSTAVAALLQQGKEYEATELAWRLMTSSSPGQSPASTPAQVQQETLMAQNMVRQEVVDAARKDAGVITTAGGGVHEAPPQYAGSDDVAAAAAYGTRTSDFAPWRRAALDKFMDFNSPLFKI